MQAASGNTLKPYQRIGIRFLAARKRACLFDEPGVGKTPQAIGAVPAGAPVLVACPNVVKGKWLREFQTWRPGWRLTSVTAGSATDPAVFRWPQPGEVVFVNYEMLPAASAEIARLETRAGRSISAIAARGYAARAGQLARTRQALTLPHTGTVCISDEVHRVKSRDAKVTARWRELATMALARSGRAWGLSGTPLVNWRDELFTVLQAVGLGEQLFGDLRSYRADWAEGRVASRIADVMLRRTRAEVLPELPPVTWDPIPVEIGDELRTYCDRLLAVLRTRGYFVRTLTLDALQRAAQPGSGLDGCIAAVRARLAALKIRSLLELVADAEESDTPLVVFSSHRAPIDVLARRPGWTCLTGDETAVEKTRRAEAFQAGQFRGIALTYQSGGEGIDLYRAWRIVLVDLPWTPKDIDQATSRLRRIGQMAKVILVSRLVAAHPIEEHVDEVLIRKFEEIAKLFPGES